MKYNSLKRCGLILPLLVLLGGCSLQTSVHNTPMPPSRQLETAATLLDMLQTYRALPEKRQAIFLQAVADEYQRRNSADNVLRLAMLLSVPENPASDLARAQRLLEHLLSVPWALRADALNLARLRYQQVQHLLACKQQRTKNQKEIAALAQQVKTLQKKINALTKIEKTVNTPSPMDEKTP
ncbi:MAG TPA: hypothetical protein VFP95_01905 [Gammaproteobacteria bacterium]|nr:hypothetical protein [Gammaproteobacteria bacterium]